jgi:hypothetical protein
MTIHIRRRRPIPEPVWIGKPMNDQKQRRANSAKRTVFSCSLLAALCSLPCSLTQAAAYLGPGHTTHNCIDWDGDGYGVGAGCLGPDADDNDAAVNTPTTMLAKYGGSLSAFLTHKGYSPLGAVYVSPTGNDSACARQANINTATAPCLTGAKAISLMQPGDAVLWRAGAYTMSATLNIKAGTAANPSLYMAYPGEKVILDWSACNNNSGGGCYGITANDLSYWTMDGLVFNGGNGGYGVDEQGYGNPTNVTIRNSEFVGWYDQLFIQGGSTNLLIERNHFHNLYIWGEHNLYLGANPNISPGLIIRNNIIAQSGQGGGHQIHLNGRFSAPYIGGNIMYGSENEVLGIQEGVSHGMFENNLIWTDLHGAFFMYDYGDQSDPSNIAYDQNYNTFRNNTFYYDGGDWYNQDNACNLQLGRISDLSGSTCVKNGGTCSATLACSGGTGGSCSYSNGYNGALNITHDLGHNTFDNNIFVTNCPAGANANAQIEIDTDINGGGGLAWLQTDTFRNNIIYNAGPATSFLTVNSYTGATTYNTSGEASYTFAQFESNLGTGAGTNLQSDPLFTAANPSWTGSPQNFNLQLQAGSPARGAAFAGDEAPTDITGATRTSNDIGAFQFGSGGVASPPAITSFIANPTSITSGQSSTLSWAVSNATSVVIDNNVGNVTVVTSTGVNPNATTTYTLTAWGLGGGPVSQQVTVTVTAASPPPSGGAYIGPGHTTSNCIDWDGDGYGVGPGCKGPDADDNDPTVNTSLTVLAKYGTIANFLSTVKGYNPNNIWYLSTTGNDSTCVANNAGLPCATFATVWEQAFCRRCDPHSRRDLHRQQQLQHRRSCHDCRTP